MALSGGNDAACGMVVVAKLIDANNEQRIYETVIRFIDKLVHKCMANSSFLQFLRLFLKGENVNHNKTRKSGEFAYVKRLRTFIKRQG